MTFKEYQEKAKTTAIYPEVGEKYIYPVLGLCGETGELAEKVKKIFRDDKGIVTEERRQIIQKELGDVLWYLSQVCTEFEFSLEDIASSNLEKLLSRKDRGKITGDGDNR